MSDFKERVFAIVSQIPRGKVLTYGDIAEILGNSGAARAVGNALHTNTNPERVPCHRVVNSAGRLAPHYAFGGTGEQAKRLIAEGVEIWRGRVNLDIYRADKSTFLSV